jgi:O-antigen ligase
MSAVVSALLILLITLGTPFQFGSYARLAVLCFLFASTSAWACYLSDARWKRHSIIYYRLVVTVYASCVLLAILSNDRQFVYQEYLELVNISTLAVTVSLGFVIGQAQVTFRSFTVLFVLACSLYALVNLGLMFDAYFGGAFEWFFSIYAPDHTLYASAILSAQGEAPRWSGLWPNPNAHGAALCVLLFGLILTSRDRLWNKLLIGSYVLLVVLSQSRTAVASLALSAPLLLIAGFGRAAIVARGAFFLGFLVLACTLVVDQMNLSFVRSLIVDDMFEQPTLVIRSENWLRLLRMVMDRPLLGHSQYAEYFLEENIHADSEYVLVIWRYGLLGIAAFVALVVFPTAYAWRSPPHSGKARAVLVSLGICTFFLGLTNVTVSDYRFCVLYALVVGLCLGQIDLHGGEGASRAHRCSGGSNF